VTQPSPNLQPVEFFLRFNSYKEAKISLEKSIAKQPFGYAINATSVVHSPAALQLLLSSTAELHPFFIDPQTYLLQLDPLKYFSFIRIEEGESQRALKHSVEGVQKQLGEPGLRMIETMSKPALPYIERHLPSLVEKTLEFQVHFLQDYKEQLEEDGFYDYIDAAEQETQTITPRYIVPPYFYMSIADSDDWLLLNQKAISEALDHSLAKQYQLVPEIVIEKQILFSERLQDNIIKIYNQFDQIDTLFLWVDLFDETGVSLAYLERFIEFIKKFKGKRIINLYGGYFSLMLSRMGLLSGFCHSAGYGEYRSVEPGLSGDSNAKFYLPLVGQTVDFELAYAILRRKKMLNKNYFSRVCNCRQCKKTLDQEVEEINFEAFGNYKLSNAGRLQIPTEETLRSNQMHYLLRRFKDLKVKNNNKDKDNFQEFIEWNKREKLISTEHLENWLNILNEL
jgi:hypothetical protein